MSSAFARRAGLDGPCNDPPEETELVFGQLSSPYGDDTPMDDFFQWPAPIGMCLLFERDDASSKAVAAKNGLQEVAAEDVPSPSPDMGKTTKILLPVVGSGSVGGGEKAKNNFPQGKTVVAPPATVVGAPANCPCPPSSDAKKALSQKDRRLRKKQALLKLETNYTASKKKNSKEICADENPTKHAPTSSANDLPSGPTDPPCPLCSRPMDTGCLSILNGPPLRTPKPLNSKQNLFGSLQEGLLCSDGRSYIPLSNLCVDKGDTTKLIRCGHVFHVVCLAKWHRRCSYGVGAGGVPGEEDQVEKDSSKGCPTCGVPVPRSDIIACLARVEGDLKQTRGKVHREFEEIEDPYEAQALKDQCIHEILNGPSSFDAISAALREECDRRAGVASTRPGTGGTSSSRTALALKKKHQKTGEKKIRKLEKKNKRAYSSTAPIRMYVAALRPRFSPTISALLPEIAHTRFAMIDDLEGKVKQQTVTHATVDGFHRLLFAGQTVGLMWRYMTSAELSDALPCLELKDDYVCPDKHVYVQCG